MSRTVHTPHGAAFTVYFTDEGSDEYLSDRRTHDFACLIDALQDTLCSRFASLTRSSRAFDREGRVVACNAHGDFVLCEYRGLCSLSFVPNDTPLAERWAEQVEPAVLAMFPSRLVKVGTFSNGEAVYRWA